MNDKRTCKNEIMLCEMFAYTYISNVYSTHKINEKNCTPYLFHCFTLTMAIELELWYIH